MSLWRLVLRQLARDWRSGELRLLFGALTLAVAAITAVGFFTDRVDRAMSLYAAELLAADLAVEWSEPLGEEFDQAARERGLRVARTLTFPSVLLHGDRPVLVQVKAVNPNYPLRGELRTADAPGGSPRVESAGPPPGEAWAEARLLPLLGAKPGDTLTLGNLQLRLSRVISHEPDRGGNLFQLAPRLMIGLTNVADSGLLGPASRVKYRSLFAGPPGSVLSFKGWLENRLPQGAELLDLSNARPELRAALDQGGRFIGLAAITAVMLAGAAAALSTRRFLLRQSDAVALLRTFGASRPQVTLLFTLRVLAIGVLASAAGSLLGLLAQQVLTIIIGGWFHGELPPPSMAPIVAGLVTAVAVLIGFAVPPLLTLSRVSPLRVLRRELAAPPPAAWITALLAVGILAGLVVWQSGNVALAVRVLAGVAAALFVLAATAALLVRLLRPVRRRTPSAWRYGLASLARQPALSVLQVTGFGLGIMLLLLLAVVRVDLLGAWQQTLPEGAPNQFLINIQPQQVADLEGYLRDEGISHSGLHPMIRGRLLRIGERAIESEQYASPRARRLAAREFNLSWSELPQPDNRIVAGRWWRPGDSDDAVFSVETGIAQSLGISLGDELEFGVAGDTVTGRVSNLRTVKWDSFNVNFFVVGTPALMRTQPATWITSFHLPPGRDAVTAEIAQRFPGVTQLDVGALIRQVRDITDRGALAVEYVFGFTIAAGVLALFAGIQAGRELRLQEAAVLRTLGASRGMLLRAVLVEFAALGALAGLLGATAAEMTAQVLAVQIFDLPWRFNPLLWLLGISGGALGVAIAGWLATRPLLDVPPVQVLRRA